MAFNEADTRVLQRNLGIMREEIPGADERLTLQELLAKLRVFGIILTRKSLEEFISLDNGATLETVEGSGICYRIKRPG